MQFNVDTNYGPLDRTNLYVQHFLFKDLPGEQLPSPDTKLGLNWIRTPGATVCLYHNTDPDSVPRTPETSFIIFNCLRI